jgi:hypothetical protein
MDECHVFYSLLVYKPPNLWEEIARKNHNLDLNYLTDVTHCPESLGREQALSKRTFRRFRII